MNFLFHQDSRVHVPYYSLGGYIILKCTSRLLQDFFLPNTPGGVWYKRGVNKVTDSTIKKIQSFQINKKRRPRR